MRKNVLVILTDLVDIDHIKDENLLALKNAFNFYKDNARPNKNEIFTSYDLVFGLIPNNQQIDEKEEYKIPIFNANSNEACYKKLLRYNFTEGLERVLGRLPNNKKPFLFELDHGSPRSQIITSPYNLATMDMLMKQIPEQE